MVCSSCKKYHHRTEFDTLPEEDGSSRRHVMLSYSEARLKSGQKLRLERFDCLYFRNLNICPTSNTETVRVKQKIVHIIFLVVFNFIMDIIANLTKTKM